MCLMFEMKDEGESDPRKLAQMMQSLGVFISVKPKAKQAAKVFHHHSPLILTQRVFFIQLAACLCGLQSR